MAAPQQMGPSLSNSAAKPAAAREASGEASASEGSAGDGGQKALPSGTVEAMPPAPSGGSGPGSGGSGSGGQSGIGVGRDGLSRIGGVSTVITDGIMQNQQLGMLVTASFEDI